MLRLSNRFRSAASLMQRRLRRIARRCRRDSGSSSSYSDSVLDAASSESSSSSAGGGHDLFSTGGRGCLRGRPRVVPAGTFFFTCITCPDALGDGCGTLRKAVSAVAAATVRRASPDGHANPNGWVEAAEWVTAAGLAIRRRVADLWPFGRGVRRLRRRLRVTCALTSRTTHSSSFSLPYASVSLPDSSELRSMQVAAQCVACHGGSLGSAAPYSPQD